MFHMMVRVAQGQSPAFALDSVLQQYARVYPPNALELFFTSNHDENSWNKADYGTMPGPIHAPFAVFTLTMPHSVPLIYSGQEEPVLDSLSFFYKDTIHFEHYGRAKFYKTLLQLREKNSALAANAGFRKIHLGNDSTLYSYVREAKDKKIFVILNLSSREQTIKIPDTSLYGTPYNVFVGNSQTLNGNPWKIEPWGYVVYSY
jgi:glycosidase